MTSDLAITPGGRVGDASPLGKGKRKLSDYEREVAHALMRKGHSKREAIQIARGVIDRAAATGRWGKGKAKANVRAGAVASIAQRKASSASHDLAWVDFDAERKRELAKTIRHSRVSSGEATAAQRELARRLVSKTTSRTKSQSRRKLATLNYANAVLDSREIDLSWIEALHPRDDHGKFASKGSFVRGKGQPRKSLEAANADLTYRKHRAYVEKQLDANEHLATHHEHGVEFDHKGVPTKYTEERDALHRKLVDKEYRRQSKTALAERKALFLGGLPGAGKTTALGKLDGLNTDHYITVNPDNFKEEMAKRGLVPSIEGLSPLEASALVHEESSHMALMLAEKARRNKKNTIWDITMASPGSVQKRIEPLKESGYQLNATFVDIPHSMSATRVGERHRRGYEQYNADTTGTHVGQRLVPSSHIEAAKSSIGSTSANRDVFDQLKGQFDAYRSFDNSGDTPQLQESKGLMFK